MHVMLCPSQNKKPLNELIGNGFIAYVILKRSDLVLIFLRFLLHMQHPQYPHLLLGVFECHPIRILFKCAVIARVIFLEFIKRVFPWVVGQAVYYFGNALFYFLCARVGFFFDVLLCFPKIDGSLVVPNHHKSLVFFTTPSSVF